MRWGVFFCFLALAIGTVAASCTRHDAMATEDRNKESKKFIIPLDYLKECGLEKEVKNLKLGSKEHSELLEKKSEVFLWEKDSNEANPGVELGKNGFVTVTLCGDSYKCTAFFFSKEKPIN